MFGCISCLAGKSGCSSVVERRLAKAEVAGSKPVTRSKFLLGGVAKW